MVDYLVIGLGLAGISFCEKLSKEEKSFIVIDDNSQRASIVAGGLYNPVILKRFSLAWRADKQLEEAIPFYQGLEEKLEVKLDYKVPVLRIFASIEEQNLWFEAADRLELQEFLSTDLVTNQNPNLRAPYGFGKVLSTGRVHTSRLVESYAAHLKKRQSFRQETFSFKDLEIHKDFFRYKDIKAKNLVYTLGFGLKENPFFNYLPLNGTKGELLTIKAPELEEASVIKSSVFIIPIGNDQYRIGATYKWKDKVNMPTPEAKQELLEKLDTFVDCPYEVERHVAGIRPTVADRRPLVGRHPEYKNMYVLNGLGSRGVLIAPYAAHRLFDFIEKQQPFDKEMDISRFAKRYQKA
jgi:glycine/D-amino acid oxidase-like deaminating enzyme